MIKVRKIIAKTPLLLRVMFCYILLACCFLLINRPATSISTVAVSKNLTTHSPISKVVIDGDPELLIVDRFNIKLPIRKGYYDESSDSWSLSDDAVYFAVLSTKPNNQLGSTVIYGHNNEYVIGRLQDIAIGDVVSIETNNSHTFTYIYSSDRIVSPNSTDILYESTPVPRLVIVTCDGLWSQSRRLMYFDLIKAS